MAKYTVKTNNSVFKYQFNINCLESEISDKAQSILAQKFAYNGNFSVYSDISENFNNDLPIIKARRLKYGQYIISLNS